MKFRRRVKITVKVHTNDSKRKFSIPTRRGRYLKLWMSYEVGREPFES